MSSNLKSIKGVTLNVANKVYIKEGDYDLEENLKKDAIAVFDAALEKLNFGNSAVAAKEINEWVSVVAYTIVVCSTHVNELFQIFLFW